MGTTNTTPGGTSGIKINANDLKDPQLHRLNHKLDLMDQQTQAAATAANNAATASAALAATPPVTGGDVTGPSGSIANDIPQFAGSTGKVLKDGLRLVTAVGSPGSDTNVPTEKAVRSAIPTFSGTTNYLPKYISATAIGNSALIDDGTQIYTTTRNVGIGTETLDTAGTPGTDVTIAATLRPTLTFKTGTVAAHGRVFQADNTPAGVINIGTNVFYNGSVWNRDDTAQDSSLIKLSGSTGSIRAAAAAVNPISWTTVFSWSLGGVALLSVTSLNGAATAGVLGVPGIYAVLDLTSSSSGVAQNLQVGGALAPVGNYEVVVIVEGTGTGTISCVIGYTDEYGASNPSSTTTFSGSVSRGYWTQPIYQGSSSLNITFTQTATGGSNYHVHVWLKRIS